MEGNVILNKEILDALQGLEGRFVTTNDSIVITIPFLPKVVERTHLLKILQKNAKGK